MRWFMILIIIIFLPFIGAYTFVPAQNTGIVQIWTEDDVQVYHVTNNSVTAKDALFVTLDTDENGIPDRGGVPSEEFVSLLPIGAVRGTVNGEAELRTSCQYPTIPPQTVEENFFIPLPAGECILTVRRGDATRSQTITVEANSATDLAFILPSWRNRIFLLLIILAVTVGAGYFIVRKKPRNGPSKAVLRVLTEDERRVIEYLCDRGSQLAGVVRKDLAIPKTTFHRVQERLLKKGLIEREEYGNTHKLKWNETSHPKEL